jgi:methylmalonyl-CoA/ethylmalonyl-CoA epimerase
MLGLPFHHLGIACTDIDAAAAFVTRAFTVISDSGTVHDPVQKADLRLFNEGTPGAIELVAGQMVETIIAQSMTYYHVCYVTHDLEHTIWQASELGAIRIGPAVPAVLFGGRRVIFMYTPLGLVEFLESTSSLP